jgi:hypothetical protein
MSTAVSPVNGGTLSQMKKAAEQSNENRAHLKSTSFKDELTNKLHKLRGVGAFVGQTKKAAQHTKSEEAGGKSASGPNKTNVGDTSQEPRIVYVSCTSPASIRAARTQVEELMMKSERSVPMPDPRRSQGTRHL